MDLNKEKMEGGEKQNTHHEYPQRQTIILRIYCVSLNPSLPVRVEAGGRRSSQTNTAVFVCSLIWPLLLKLIFQVVVENEGLCFLREWPEIPFL